MRNFVAPSGFNLVIIG